MKSFTAVVEKCADTGLYVGYVPGFAGAHSQGESLDELKQNLEEVVAMLLEDGEPTLDAEFVGFLCKLLLVAVLFLGLILRARHKVPLEEPEDEEPWE